MLSLFTKIASGYWHIADSQAGYTAIGGEMLELLDLDNIYPRYGYPNDMLVHLNVWNARVATSRHGRSTASARRRASAFARSFHDLLASGEGVPLADGTQLRDPRLPSARLLLHVRLLHVADRVRARELCDQQALLGHPPNAGRRSSSP